MTAKSRWYTDKATITITINPLPDYSIGTFNGILINEGGEIAGTVTFTASSAGKLSAKVATSAGTFNLSASNWNIDDGELSADLFKYTSTGYQWLWVSLGGHEWNDAHQMSGYFEVESRYGYRETYEISVMQRNVFGKGGSPDNAARRLLGNHWSIEEEDYDDTFNYRSQSSKTLVVNKNGTVKLSGYSIFWDANISGSSVLMFDKDGAFVIFCPLLKVKECAPGMKAPYCPTVKKIVPFTFRL